MLTGASSTLLNLQTLYYWLGQVGEIVNQMRAFINLGALFFKVALIAMGQPIFWGYVIMTFALVAVWFRILQMLYRRAPLMLELFI